MKNSFSVLVLLLIIHVTSFGQAEFVGNCTDITTVYELSELNGLNGDLQSSGSSNGIVFCVQDGVVDNPIWVAFTVDPYFEYTVDLNFSGCVPGQSFEQGAQIGVYESCDDWFNPIFCLVDPIEGAYRLSDNLDFDTGKTYYMMLDGYKGSVCNINLTVQKYLPMAAVTDWYHGVGGFFGSSTYWYRDVGDTIINGLEYRTIDVYPEPDFPFNRYLREDIASKKVYTYNSFSNQEVLLYDFGATIGDDIELVNVGTFTVTNIDEVESQYGNLKRWELNGPGPPIYVIEGIGSADLFLSNTASDPVYSLLCAYHESDKIYGNDDCMPPPRWTMTDTLFNAQICEGESYFFGGMEYQESGIYTDSLTNSNGGDSIVTLELNVLPASVSIIQEDICEGDFIIINGTIFDELSPAGNIIISNGASNGCDSIINVEITFLSSITENYETTFCEGDSEIWADSLITTAGDYTFNLTSINGCDSILNVSVQVLNETITETDIQICEGETIIIDGEEITESGIYQTVLEASNGCDSILVFNINFLPTIIVEESLYFCPDDPIIIDGLPVEEGVYETIYIDMNGCDSISILNVIALSESDPECLSSTYDLKSLDLLLSPNPFESTINLSAQELLESIEILSITGTRIEYIDQLNERNYRYDGSALIPGIYIMTVRSNNKIAIKRLVKN